LLPHDLAIAYEILGHLPKGKPRARRSAGARPAMRSPCWPTPRTRWR
jgi:hypothetical protein